MEAPFAKISTEPHASAAKVWRRAPEFFLRPSSPARSSLRQRLRWRRVFGAAAALLVAMHLTAVSTFFVWARFGQGASHLSYLSLLRPSRWQHYHAAIGDAQIAQAWAYAKQGRQREAHALARAGVNRSPANRAGRLLLAQLLLAAGRLDAARETLVGGLAHGRDDPKFLRPCFTLLLRHQQDVHVVALARTLLPASPSDSEPDRLVALAAATASFFRGEFDQADDFLSLAPALARSRDGRLLAAKIDGARGYRELALVSLRALAAEYPDDAAIHYELLQRLRDAGLRDEARRRSLFFQIAHPSLPRPRIELLRDLHASSEPERRAREVAAILRDFANDAAALLALADFAAEVGDPALARQLLAHAETQNLPWEPHALLLVEALIGARDYRGALESADALVRRQPGIGSTFQPVLNSLRAVAHYGLGENEPGRLLLGSFLQQPHLRAENLLAVARRLTTVDAAAPAHQALVRAVAADPLNQAALTRLVELDLILNRIDELPAHLQRLVAMRLPSPDVLRVAQHKLGSDLFLFSPDRPALLAAVRTALEKTARRRPLP